MERKAMLDANDGRLSMRQQCQLLKLNRSSLYYQRKPEDSDNVELMRLLDEEYTRHPFKGVLRMTKYLEDLGYHVNPKRVRRLLRMMGIMAIYPQRNLSAAHPVHKKYPYLLKGLTVDQTNMVWCTDLTYIRLNQGFIYLSVIMDWYSRYVLSWGLSNTMEASFCIGTLEDALLQHGKPDIFNSDQGSQYISTEFTGLLLANDIKISMDGRGRAFDNIFIERLWRSVKYEEVYIKDYANMQEAKYSLKRYFEFYNYERHHQGLAYKKPAEVYFNTRYQNAEANAFKEKLLSDLKPNRNICLKPIIDELNL